MSRSTSLRLAASVTHHVTPLLILTTIASFFGCAPAASPQAANAPSFRHRRDQLLVDNQFADLKRGHNDYVTTRPLIVHVRGGEYSRGDKRHKSDFDVVSIGTRGDAPTVRISLPGANATASTTPATGPSTDHGGVTLVKVFPFIVISDGTYYYTGNSPAGSSDHVIAGADGTTFIMTVKTNSNGSADHRVYVPALTGNGDVEVVAYSGTAYQPAKVVHPGQVITVHVDANGMLDFGDPKALSAADTTFVSDVTTAANAVGVGAS
jgi:hypothetical protein